MRASVETWISSRTSALQAPAAGKRRAAMAGDPAACLACSREPPPPAERPAARGIISSASLRRRRRARRRASIGASRTLAVQHDDYCSMMRRAFGTPSRQPAAHRASKCPTVAAPPRNAARYGMSCLEDGWPNPLFGEGRDCAFGGKSGNDTYCPAGASIGLICTDSAGRVGAGPRGSRTQRSREKALRFRFFRAAAAGCPQRES